jgi:hypothetical protein
LTNRQVSDALKMKSGVSAGVQVRRAVALKAGKLMARIEADLEGQIQENRTT